jgi:hypothetical protein
MPNFYVNPVEKKCKRCGKTYLTLSAHAQLCEKCWIEGKEKEQKKKEYCKFCGRRIKSGELFRFGKCCYKCRKKGLRDETETTNDMAEIVVIEKFGDNFCPDCGVKLVRACNGFECPNEGCDVIAVKNRYGRYEVFRDSVMTKLEVVS